jgi:4-amino-4-deoxy-L-arabinose transferase-like glycosyltransferase
VFTAQGINSDAHRYALTARHIARHGLLAGLGQQVYWPFRPLNRDLLVYPLLGSWLYRIIGDAILSLRLISAVAGVGLIPLLYILVDELFDDRETALLSAGIVAFLPEFTRASAAVYREVLMAFWLVLVAYLVIRSCRSKKYSWLLAGCSGVLIFISFLTRPEGVVILPIAVMTILFFERKLSWKRRITSCIVLSLAFCCLQIPLMIWMHGVVGNWTITPQQIEFFGNGPERYEAAQGYVEDVHKYDR